VIGNRTRTKITKNKVAAPFRQAEFDIMYNEGISKEGDVLDLGVSMSLIEKRGAFFRYNDGMLGQGRENAKQYLRDNPAIAYEIEMAIRENSESLPVGALAGASEAEPSAAYEEE
jgi:recombination protein RecA